MFGFPPRLVGLVLLGVAAVILLISALIGWNAVQRWRAFVAIEDHHLARLGGHANGARNHAETAAALLPQAAMAALPAIDPAADQAAGQLELLSRSVHPRERAIVATTAAFSAALHGNAVDGVDGADGALIKHLAALSKGGLPVFPAFSGNDAPQAAILGQAAQRHAASAWKAGNREELVRGLGLVLLTRPYHAEAKQAVTVLAALDPAADRAVLSGLIGGLGSDGHLLLRRAALLAPERAAVLTAIIPAEQRTPAEAQLLLAAGGEPGEKLESLIAKALASPSPILLADLFQRCLDQDKVDLAQKIADQAVEPHQRELRIALAHHLGDVLALAALQPERTDLKPAASPPVGGSGLIAFHLATPAGLIPRIGELRVRADGKEVPADRITRRGSLVVLLMPGASGMVEIDVKLGDTLVFAGGVSL